MERVRLRGLQPQTYEHPLDRQALDALQGTTGLETLVRKCNEYGLERLIKVQYTGSYLRVHADNFPELHRRVLDACEVLDVPRIPDVYVQPGGGINAMTAGVEKPILVLSTSAVDGLTDAELDFVVGHEVGHLKSGHMLYHQVALFLPVIGEIVGTATLGIGSLISAGLQMALMRWSRTSEFTGDRAGLLACQDVSAAVSAMVKLAGLPSKYWGAINTEDFLAQAREFEAFDRDWIDWAAKLVSGMGQTHPWTVLRGHELLRWIDAGDYDRVRTATPAPVAAAIAPAAAPAAAGFCTQCGRAFSGHELFCPDCGTRRPAPVPIG